MDVCGCVWGGGLYMCVSTTNRPTNTNAPLGHYCGSLGQRVQEAPPVVHGQNPQTSTTTNQKTKTKKQPSKQPTHQQQRTAWPLRLSSTGSPGSRTSSARPAPRRGRPLVDNMVWYGVMVVVFYFFLGGGLVCVCVCVCVCEDGLVSCVCSSFVWPVCLPVQRAHWRMVIVSVLLCLLCWCV
jgi:hypothetical protein